MDQAVIVARQVLIIFIYVVLGIFCARKGILDEGTGKKLSGFSLMVIVPALLIRNYARPMDADNLKGMGLALLLAAIFHLMASLGSIIAVRKRDDLAYRIERLGVVHSNSGYMAVPLIRAAIGEIGVFYAVAYICVFNICLWTLGVMLLGGRRKMNLKKAILNPGVIGFAAGMLIYLVQLPIPRIAIEALDGLVALNTPIPMITVGIFLAGLKIRDTFTKPRIYYTAFLKLLLLPVIMIFIVKAIGAVGWVSNGYDVVYAIILACACPCAAAIVLLPVTYGMKGDYGAQLMAVTTLFSIITLPLITLAMTVLI